jgi:GTP-binding protein HflX
MGNAPDAHETHAWVLHPDIKTDQSARAASDALAESVSLAHALPGLEVMGETIVRLPRAHPGKLFGKGKIAELAELFKAAGCGARADRWSCFTGTAAQSRKGLGRQNP